MTAISVLKAMGMFSSLATPLILFIALLFLFRLTYTSFRHSLYLNSYDTAAIIIACSILIYVVR